MQISMSSIFITLIMSTILILLFVLLLLNKRLVRFLRMDVLLALVIVIIARMLFPIELPFTVTIAFPLLMNNIQAFMNYEVFSNLTVFNILCVIWALGSMIQLIRYFLSLKKINAIIGNLKRNCDHKSVSDFLSIDPKYDYPVWVTKEITTPMVIGLKKVILLPEIELSSAEVNNVVTHELQHIKNHDNLFKQVLNILKIIYWWFPPIYWLSNKFQLSLEMRVDQQTTKQYTKSQTMEYIETLIRLKELIVKQDKKYNHSALPISSSFFIGEDNKVLTYRIDYLLNSNYRKRTNLILLGIIILLPFLSNSIVFEAYFSEPYSSHETYTASDLKNGYITHYSNGSYTLTFDGIEIEIENPNSKEFNNVPIIERR